jgi:hypothetical protein
MTQPPNAVAAKGGQMAIRRISAFFASNQDSKQFVREIGEHPMVSTTRAPHKRSRHKMARHKLARRLLAVVCLGVLVADTTGCMVTRNIAKEVRDCDCVDDFMTNYRNRAMAEKAWHCRKDRFGQQMYMREYKEGFIDGYLEIAEGGPGCCPTVAPSRYWGWQYQSANGQAAVNAWFEGYPMGVQAAEQDGVGHYQHVFVMGGDAAGGVGAGGSCNSCGSGIAVPVYPQEQIYQEGEIIPMPVPEADASGGEIEMVIPPPPDSANYVPKAQPSRLPFNFE